MFEGKVIFNDNSVLTITDGQDVVKHPDSGFIEIFCVDSKILVSVENMKYFELTEENE